MPEERHWESFFDAEEVLNLLGLTKEVHDAADIGCGYGTFSIPAAERIHGVVHAIEIEQELLNRAVTRARDMGLYNIRPHIRDIVEEGSGLPDASVDYVMLFNILHASEPVRLLRESGRILRPGGRVAVLHWRSDVLTPRGPNPAIRPRPEQIRPWALEAGLEAMDPVYNIGQFHFGMMLRRTHESNSSCSGPRIL